MRPPPPDTAGRGIPRPAMDGRKNSKAAVPDHTQKPDILQKGNIGFLFSRKPAKPAADQTVRLERMAQALSLPADTLSYSILRFAGHFSLPMDRKLLHDIRREALSPKSGREAAALASCAAHAKDMPLDQAALELYAAAADPSITPDRGDGGDSSRRRRKGTDDRDDETEQAPPEAAAASPLPLLCALNTRKDAAGARWVVVPFDFSKNGIEFRTSVRLLFNGTTVVRLAVDTAWESTRRTVVVDAPMGYGANAAIVARPPYDEGIAGERIKDLEALLRTLFDGLTVRVDTEASHFSDCMGIIPAPVDEEA